MPSYAWLHPIFFDKSARSFLFLCPLFIFAYSYNFKKLSRIETVLPVFIFKNISHLIADYTGSAKHSVNVGMRMPVDPGINLAVGYQLSVFTGKGAVQYGTLMMQSNYLECRQVMCNHHDMGGCTLLDAFPDKLNTSLVHQVELLRLQQHSVEPDLTEVVHAFPHEILVVRIDTRPQRTQNEIGVIDANNLILIVADILT